MRPGGTRPLPRRGRPLDDPHSSSLYRRSRSRSPPRGAPPSSYRGPPDDYRDRDRDRGGPPPLSSSSPAAYALRGLTYDAPPPPPHGGTRGIIAARRAQQSPPRLPPAGAGGGGGGGGARGRAAPPWVHDTPELHGEIKEQIERAYAVGLLRSGDVLHSNVAGLAQMPLRLALAVSLSLCTPHGQHVLLRSSRRPCTRGAAGSVDRRW